MSSKQTKMEHGNIEEKDDNMTQDSNQIIEMVCKSCNISIDDLLSKRRKKNLVDARQICCILMYRLGFNQQKIGKLLNYKDHTTVNYHLSGRRANSATMLNRANLLLINSNASYNA